jgi:hypothetical protein
MLAGAASAATSRYLVSPQNSRVSPAAPGEVQPLQLGRHITLDVSRAVVCLTGAHVTECLSSPHCPEQQVPLLAAPLAGITAAPLRLMYTQVGAVVLLLLLFSAVSRTRILPTRQTTQQAGARLAVSEMVIASTLRDGNKASAHLTRFHPNEALRSAQLYGVSHEPLTWACRCVFIWAKGRS